MMEFKLTLFKERELSEQEGEQMTSYTLRIIKSLLESSAEKSILMPFTQANQQIIAEEIGYRRALQDLASHFTFLQEN